MPSLEGLEHRPLGRRWGAGHEQHQLVAGAYRRVVERELHCRAMAGRALGDRSTEGRDPGGKIAWSAFTKLLESDISLTIEVGVIPLD